MSINEYPDDLSGDHWVLGAHQTQANRPDLRSLAPLPNQVPLLITVRESNEYDHTLMENMVLRTLSYAGERSAVQTTATTTTPS